MRAGIGCDAATFISPNPSGLRPRRCFCSLIDRIASPPEQFLCHQLLTAPAGGLYLGDTDLLKRGIYAMCECNNSGLQ
jgi:hypothetical protein